MMPEAAQEIITPEEYFAMEEAAEYKSEYYYSEIFAMSGASYHHNVIAVNLIHALHSALIDKPCQVFSSDMKVQVDEAVHYTYPDVSVVCGDIEFARGRDDIIKNPAVIFEILSESTKDYDRGSKFTAYRKIKSLQNYIVVDQYACHVEYFYKNETGKWTLEEFADSDDRFIIRAIDAELSLKTIYERIKW